MYELFTSSFGFLTIKPKLRVEGHKFIASTSLSFRVLSLFFRNKVVSIDRRTKLVKIESTWFWVFKNTTIIPFQRIKGISYKYDNFWFDWALNFGSSDQVEEFVISLELTKPEGAVKLFSFIGEGRVDTIFPDYDLVDLQGTQESSSKNFVELVMSFTEKQLI